MNLTEITNISLQSSNTKCLTNRHNKNSLPQSQYDLNDLRLMLDCIFSYLVANSPVEKRIVAVDFVMANTLPPQFSESCFKRFLIRV